MSENIKGWSDSTVDAHYLAERCQELQQENERLEDENEKLRKELKDLRIELAKEKCVFQTCNPDYWDEACNGCIVKEAGDE